jgi:4-hydroxy-tetrahydrodipicolinate synthase
MFEGSIVAIVTPFRNGEVDEKKLVELVDWHVAEGTSGIVPCGTTGESPTLSYKEHGRVIEIVVKAARKRVPVIAGTGSNSTREAIEMTHHAREVGVDASLMVCPYYNKPTQKGLIEHYRAVVREVPLPIVLYNIPGRTGVNMLPATVIELVKAESKIVGIKEATGSMDQTSEILAGLPDFTVLSGDDSLTLPLMSIGAKGVISVVANLLPKDTAALCAAAKAGDWARARSLHLKLFPLIKSLFVETNPIPIKAAMGWVERCAPDVRLPLTPIEESSAKKLESAMRAYGGLLAPVRRHPAC